MFRRSVQDAHSTGLGQPLEGVMLDTVRSVHPTCRYSCGSVSGIVTTPFRVAPLTNHVDIEE